MPTEQDLIAAYQRGWNDAMMGRASAATVAEPGGSGKRGDPWTDLLTYVLQDDLHNRLTPRVIDIAYTAFMAARQPNKDDGGLSDWFNDTRPVVREAIEKLRKDLYAERAAQQQAEPGADERAACDAAYERWTTSPDFRQYNKPGFDAGYRTAQSGLQADPYPTLRLCRLDGQASDVFIHAMRRDEATGIFDVLVSTSEERNGQRADD